MAGALTTSKKIGDTMTFCLRKIKSTRKRPQPDDIVSIAVSEDMWMFGRVVASDASFDEYKTTKDAILFYLFNICSKDSAPPKLLPTSRLLVPPLLISDEGWQKGYFVFVENRNFFQGEKLAQHCFLSPGYYYPTYFDEYANKLAKKSEPCGLYVLTLIAGVEKCIRQRLAELDARSP